MGASVAMRRYDMASYFFVAVGLCGITAGAFYQLVRCAVRSELEDPGIESGKEETHQINR